MITFPFRIYFTSCAVNFFAFSTIYIFICYNTGESVKTVVKVNLLNKVVDQTK